MSALKFRYLHTLNAYMSIKKMHVWCLERESILSEGLPQCIWIGANQRFAWPIITVPFLKPTSVSPVNPIFSGGIMRTIANQMDKRCCGSCPPDRPSLWCWAESLPGYRADPGAAGGGCGWWPQRSPASAGEGPSHGLTWSTLSPKASSPSAHSRRQGYFTQV